MDVTKKTNSPTAALTASRWKKISKRKRKKKLACPNRMHMLRLQ
jgi:hypothetical protein